MCPSLSMLSGLMSLHQNNPREETQIVSRHTPDHRQIVGLHPPMNETVRPPDRKNALCDIELVTSSEVPCLINIVIESPPAKNSMMRYGYVGPWSE